LIIFQATKTQRQRLDKEEAGAAAADVSVRASSCAPLLQTDVEQAPSTMSAAEAEAIFMARFNLSPNCDTVQGGDGNQIQIGASSSKARIDEAGGGNEGCLVQDACRESLHAAETIDGKYDAGCLSFAASGTSEDLRRSLTSARIGVAMSTTFSESKSLDAADVLLQVCACLSNFTKIFFAFLCALVQAPEDLELGKVEENGLEDWSTRIIYTSQFKNSQYLFTIDLPGGSHQSIRLY